MISAALLWFVVVLVLGIVGNIMAARSKAFSTGWEIWFWNIVWVLALRMVWIT